MKKALALIAAALILMLTLTIGISADGLPDIPEGNFKVKSSATQVTGDDIVTMTTEAAKKGTRMVPAIKDTTVDISDKEYIYLWIYVSDSNLLYDNNGDGIELCSGGKQDIEENALYFYYDKEITTTVNIDYTPLQSGWNEYLFKISDFRIMNGGTLNPAALNFVGLVIRSNPEGLTFAMSTMYAVNLEDLEYDASKIVLPAEETTAVQTEAQTTVAPVITDAPSTTVVPTTTKTPETTKAPETTAKPADETKPTDTKGGCGSAMLSTGLILAVIGCGVVLGKKHEKN